MHSNRHCIICGGVIFAGMYCSDCAREISRARTSDDEEFVDWLCRTREKRLLSSSGERNSVMCLDNFGVSFNKGKQI